ncbi:MAG: hypothetical protein ACO1OQ_00020 [Rufibacter sp.]
MKTLKNVTSAALLAVAMLFGGNAVAQGGGQGGAKLTVEERAQMQVDRFQKQLDLTPDQNARIKAIIVASAQEIDKLRSAGTKPSREAMVALNQKRSDQIKAVLTAAQKEKFEQQQAEQIAKMKERGGNGQGDGQAKKEDGAKKKEGGKKKKKGEAETDA